MLPLLLILSAVPEKAAPVKADAGIELAPPTPREMATLFFLAGDLKRAIDAAMRCVQLEGRKKCEPVYRALVEYEALIPKNDQLTIAEAKSYLEWDRLVSPKEPGKLTRPVLERYVTAPLEAARIALQAGEKAQAKAAVERVLQVDPKNAEAKALLKQVEAAK